MNHVRKFTSPDRAISAALCTAFPIRWRAGVVGADARQTDNGYVAILRLDVPEEHLFPSDKERLKGLLLEHVEPEPELPPEDDYFEWDADEAWGHDPEEDYTLPEVRAKHGAASRFVKREMQLNPNIPPDELYAKGVALGFKRTSLYGATAYQRSARGIKLRPAKRDQKAQPIRNDPSPGTISAEIWRIVRENPGASAKQIRELCAHLGAQDTTIQTQRFRCLRASRGTTA